MRQAKRNRIAAGFLAMALLAASACGGSIWAKRGINDKPLYADDKANQIGDVVTIIISEEHKVDNKVKRDLERSSQQAINFDSKDLSIGSLHPLPDVRVAAGSEKSLEGKSDYKDERSIEDSITAVVEDIHPNGNLVIIGTRTREVNGDKQIIQVSGIVRPSDISYDNVVRSSQVANFQLVAMSEGATADYTKPGWLGKILNALWPF
ncbi:MAG: flagellar basal body L-ring protein FlgH [Planctomycetaceae bacterium]|nr:flagellar basal body L-ring protein FlgH [Planctomycetaceae bacterium]